MDSHKHQGNNCESHPAYQHNRRVGVRWQHDLPASELAHPSHSQAQGAYEWNGSLRRGTRQAAPPRLHHRSVWYPYSGGGGSAPSYLWTGKGKASLLASERIGWLTPFKWRFCGAGCRGHLLDVTRQRVPTMVASVCPRTLSPASVCPRALERAMAVSSGAAWLLHILVGVSICPRVADIAVHSSVGRASDCRACSDQSVPGSIPGGRISWLRPLLCADPRLPLRAAPLSSCWGCGALQMLRNLGGRALATRPARQ